MSNSGDAQNASAPLLPLLMAHYDVLLYAGQMDATLGPISLDAAVDKVVTVMCFFYYYYDDVRMLAWSSVF
jgi:hypothetical protein